MILDALRTPVVLAPLAGGPSTPALASAVSEGGGLGFLAAGYLSAEATRARIGELRALTSAPFGVNLFVPPAGPADPAAVAAYVERLAAWAAREGVELGSPRSSDDEWAAKLDLLAREPVPVVSFTFGRPETAVVASLHGAGSEVWVTVTSPSEARAAVAAGADVVVAQGAAGGGHRASFVDGPEAPVLSLLPLVQLIRAAERVPVVASGGVATGGAVAGVLAAGAAAAQLGTAFMLAPEAGTSAAHRAAIRSDAPTVLTRAFTGRLARGIRNRFTDAFTDVAPAAYPELHFVTAPMRQRGRETDDAGLVNLWAGEAHALAREAPARGILEGLAAEARAAFERPQGPSARS
jgi:nitronate monooxygenase